MPLMTRTWNSSYIDKKFGRHEKPKTKSVSDELVINLWNKEKK